MELDAALVALPDLPTTLMADRVRSEYERQLEIKGGRFYESDWKRVSYMQMRARESGSLIDVGAGAGQFANMIALAGTHQRVVTLDRVRNDYWLQLDHNLDEHRGEIDAMPYGDGEFDVVVCMEVLEHLPEEIFRPAISELRRICGGQLLMTVPYKEPEPLYESHMRRFEDEDLWELFPNGHFTILGGIKKPWVVIEERCDASKPDRSSDLAPLMRMLGELNTDRKQLQRRLKSSEASLARVRNFPAIRLARFLRRRLLK
jgi:SAM-dependent methyltransferase